MNLQVFKENIKCMEYLQAKLINKNDIHHDKPSTSPYELLTENFMKNTINPFHATDLFLYSLKTSENWRFSDVFKGYRNKTIARNGLTTLTL